MTSLGDFYGPGLTLTWETVTSAVLSPCRTYRYGLSRTWGSAEDGSIPALVVVGLNPSTADEVKDDPTIRRCLSFATAWGYGRIHMLNLFAFRATDPRELTRYVKNGEPKTAADERGLVQMLVGPDNDKHLAETCCERRVLVAWGRGGQLGDRAMAVVQTLQRVKAELVCLGVNQDGSPVHPLYQPKAATPRRWEPRS